MLDLRFRALGSRFGVKGFRVLGFNAHLWITYIHGVCLGTYSRCMVRTDFGHVWYGLSDTKEMGKVKRGPHSVEKLVLV